MPCGRAATPQCQRCRRRHSRTTTFTHSRSDYVLTVARDDKAADIDGWVTVVNGSGTSFKNAKLQLVAGDLNRVRQVINRMERDAMRKSSDAAVSEMSQEAFSDYHLYTLGRKTTV